MLKPTSVAAQRAKQQRQLQADIHHIRHHRLLHVYENPWVLIGFFLLKGMAFGLGTLLGATLVASLAIYLLSHMEVIPIIGEWVHEWVLVLRSQQQS